MLSVYVDAMNVIRKLDRAGEDCTYGKLAKELGISRYKAKKAFDDLVEFGLTYTHEKFHRPNVKKSTLFISPVGSSWLTAMNLYRMERF